MNKILIDLRVIFLILVPVLCGCGDSQTKWEQLYRTEEDDIVVEAELIGDDTIDDDLEGTQEDTQDVEYIENNNAIQSDQKNICVYICGAVVSPGVYELPEGARVVQVIEAAGGLTEDADSLLVNQAKIVEDGEQIRIYTKEEASQVQIPMDTGGSSVLESKIDINTAVKDVLMTLPGIGEAKADAIIAYREQNGGFQSIEDIMNISGIKDAVFSKIKDKITV